MPMSVLSGQGKKACIEYFQEVVVSLQAIGLSSHEIAEIERILAGILELGQLLFKQDGMMSASFNT